MPSRRLPSPQMSRANRSRGPFPGERDQARQPCHPLSRCNRPRGAIMTFAIQRLNEGVRASLVAHFLALPMRDRSLRFGAALAPTVIAKYVDGIDFDRDAVLGLHDDRLALVGVAHVAFVDDLAEVGLSVLP